MAANSYRIERISLNSEQAYRFAQDYNGISPTEPVQVEEWQVSVPPGTYDGPYWRAEWWARVPVAKSRAALRHADKGERSDDFAFRQEWWTGEHCPRPMWWLGVRPIRRAPSGNIFYIRIADGTKAA